MPGGGSPAVLHPAADDLPVVITVDTSLLVASIDASDRHHSIAWSVYRSLVESGTVVAICQPLLMLEFWSAMRKTSNRLEAADVDQLVTEARSRLSGQLALFHDEVPRDLDGKRAFLVRAGEELLARWLAPLRIVRVRLTNALLDSAREVLIEYGLDSHDALITAVAHKTSATAGIAPAIATLDRGFERVTDLHLWGRR